MNFKQSTIFSIAASLGLIIFNMLINVIESRVLGPSEIGRYQIFITTQNLFATFCALGLGQSCIYFINALKVDERKVLSTTINATIPIASFASLVLFAIIMLKPDYFGKENVWCITLFCLGTNALLLNNIFTPVLLAKMDVVKNQVVKYSTKVFTFIILLVALFIWNKLNVGFLLALSGIGSILSLSILYHYFHRRFSFQDGIDKKLFYNIVKWGVKLAGNNIASLILTSIPVYFLTWFSISEGFLNVGYYSRANSLLIIGTVIASSVGPLLYSKWSLVKGKELKLQVRRVSLLLAFVNTLLAIGLIIFAPIFIRILYGTEYQTAAPVLRLLALTMIANGAKEVIITRLAIKHHEESCYRYNSKRYFKLFYHTSVWRYRMFCCYCISNLYNGLPITDKHYKNYRIIYERLLYSSFKRRCYVNLFIQEKIKYA